MRSSSSPRYLKFYNLVPFSFYPRAPPPPPHLFPSFTVHSRRLHVLLHLLRITTDFLTASDWSSQAGGDQEAVARPGEERRGDGWDEIGAWGGWNGVKGGGREERRRDGDAASLRVFLGWWLAVVSGGENQCWWSWRWRCRTWTDPGRRVWM